MLLPVVAYGGGALVALLLGLAVLKLRAERSERAGLLLAAACFLSALVFAALLVITALQTP